MKQPAQSNSQNLHRRLGFVDGLALYVGVILGSGIFFAPAYVAAAAPGLWQGVSLWALGGLIAAMGGLTYAECGARLPQDGGFYVFYRQVFGPGMAFVGGWLALLLTYPASIAAIAMLMAKYLQILLPDLAQSTVAAVAIIIATGINAAGVRAGPYSQRLLTALKVGLVLALCLAALWVDGATPSTAAPVAKGPIAFGAILGAMVGILWTYSGWSDLPLIAGELKDPAKSLGRTVLWGSVVLISLYATVHFAVVHILGANAAASSQQVMADAVAHAFGGDFGHTKSLLAWVVVISTFGALMATLLGSSRLAFSMGLDPQTRAPTWFSGRDKSGDLPRNGILLCGFLSFAYAVWGDFKTLLELFTFSVWIFYGATGLALLKLRQQKIGEPIGWKAPKAAPWILMATSLWMTASFLSAADKRGQALYGLGIISIVVLCFVLLQRLRPLGKTSGS